MTNLLMTICVNFAMKKFVFLQKRQNIANSNKIN